jgi:hypothetical protein
MVPGKGRCRDTCAAVHEIGQQRAAARELYLNGVCVVWLVWGRGRCGARPASAHTWRLLHAPWAGTAKAVVASFVEMGIPFSLEQIELVREPKAQASRWPGGQGACAHACQLVGTAAAA